MSVEPSMHFVCLSDLHSSQVPGGSSEHFLLEKVPWLFSQVAAVSFLHPLFVTQHPVSCWLQMLRHCTSESADLKSWLNPGA